MKIVRIIDIVFLILYGFFIFTVEIIEYPEPLKTVLYEIGLVYSASKLVYTIVKLVKNKKSKGD